MNTPMSMVMPYHPLVSLVHEVTLVSFFLVVLGDGVAGPLDNISLRGSFFFGSGVASRRGSGVGSRRVSRTGAGVGAGVVPSTKSASTVHHQSSYGQSFLSDPSFSSRNTSSPCPPEVATYCTNSSAWACVQSRA